uniref:Reverse transcriptase domain-containing protein n=1 Tax=Tanacetum cinerariifolium TaxID=118510 RepID=A0A6L2NCX7_TANCI|nr:reverse transcriptase domain-containing protein [Tanacetum cinerariifolium]
MIKTKDQRSQSMKEQAYNVDRDEDKSLTTTAISMNSRSSATMNSLRGRLGDRRGRRRQLDDAYHTLSCRQRMADKKDEKRALRMKINQYVLEEGVLFKKGNLVPMLICVSPLQANDVIQEIYIGSCGMHIGARFVVAKAIRQGYYWPTMHRDARSVTQKYDSCQVHAQISRRPKTLMTLIMAPWPFYQWGMDIRGPLPQSFEKLKFVIVAIDYFTKWIEAKPLVRITGKDVKKFMNTAVAHSHANGLVERANKSLMEGIKASLTYGSEAVIPAEIGMPTHKTMMIREDENEDELRLNMDLLQERKEAAAIREAKYKTKIEQYYNQKVRPTSFKPDEYVFRKNEASRVED